MRRFFQDLIPIPVYLKLHSRYSSLTKYHSTQRNIVAVMDRIPRKPLSPRHQSLEPSQHVAYSGSSSYHGYPEKTGTGHPQTSALGAVDGHQMAAATGAWPAASTPASEHGREWRAGLFTSFPILGLGALFLSVGCEYTNASGY